jgi:hypothetical protein
LRFNYVWKRYLQKAENKLTDDHKKEKARTPERTCVSEWSLVTPPSWIGILENCWSKHSNQCHCISENKIFITMRWIIKFLSLIWRCGIMQDMSLNQFHSIYSMDNTIQRYIVDIITIDQLAYESCTDMIFNSI